MEQIINNKIILLFLNYLNNIHYLYLYTIKFNYEIENENKILNHLDFTIERINFGFTFIIITCKEKIHIRMQ